jgi:histidine ammonia-lyase
MTVLINSPLTWRDVADVAEGRDLALSDGAWRRIENAHAIVVAIVSRGIRAYGVNTGVGALCDTIVDRDAQSRLSRNLLMSHACGIGDPLGPAETRAIIAAQINFYAHGHSGPRRVLVERLLALLHHNCLPEIPARGSIGYLTHMAEIGLVLIGAGTARLQGRRLPGAEALAALGLPPLVLEAKEGLSLINGTPCATGLACLALARTERLLDWADAIAALSFEALRGQAAAFDANGLALRASPGLTAVGERLRDFLQDSPALAAAAGRRTQDALSLRAVPHVHGAARDVFGFAAGVVDRELASVTDNPLVGGTVAAPRVFSMAHAVGTGLALALDALATAVATVATMAERRLDRLVNPLVSGLPPFLAVESGAGSGFMIAQYTAAALVAETRRLAAPASLDGGVTSGLQEDYIAHATPAAAKALAIVENTERILAIEWLMAAQAHDLGGDGLAPGTAAVYRRLRERIGLYADDRPLRGDFDVAFRLLRGSAPPRNAGPGALPPARPASDLPDRRQGAEPRREP